MWLVGAIGGVTFVLTAVGVWIKTPAVTSLVAAVKWVFSQRARAAVAKESERLDAFKELRREYRAVLKAADANRAAVVTFSNGGGNIDDVSTPKYLDCFLAVDDDTEVDVEEHLTRVETGEAYRKEILEPMIDAKGRAHVYMVADMSPENEIRKVLLADNISAVVVARAVVEPEVIWYAVLHFKDMVPDGCDVMIRRAVVEFQSERAARVLERLLPRLV
jgi:type IV secretory pathway VirJ component